MSDTGTWPQRTPAPPARSRPTRATCSFRAFVARLWSRWSDTGSKRRELLVADEPAEGIAAQTELALERIKARLEEAGARLEDVVKLVWYLTDRDLEEEFYAARDGWLGRNAPSLLEERSYASTLLIVGLAKPDMLVEIDCIAYVGVDSRR